jgi:multidrug transporter EmrE-like cation transporter
VRLILLEITDVCLDVISNTSEQPETSIGVSVKWKIGNRHTLMSQSIADIACLVLVGAFWGCTNPFIRKGATEVVDFDDKSIRITNDQKLGKGTIIQFLLVYLRKFRHPNIWMPYLLNQAGSLLFYVVLSQTALSIAVPTCNALALVFSVFTSYAILDERVNHPIRSIIGATLVMAGVIICLHANESQNYYDNVET